MPESEVNGSAWPSAVVRPLASIRVRVLRRRGPLDRLPGRYPRLCHGPFGQASRPGDDKPCFFDEVRMNTGRCESCGKAKEDLREVLRNGPRGYRRYHLCAGCRSTRAAVEATRTVAAGPEPSKPEDVP